MSKIFLVKVTWWIDGYIGRNPTTKKVIGEDVIVCLCEEVEIESCVEGFIELAGQGMNHQVIRDDLISDISNFSVSYWNFNNVSDFRHNGFEILDVFTSVQYDMNETPKYIAESIQKRYYYWK